MARFLMHTPAQASPPTAKRRKVEARALNKATNSDLAVSGHFLEEYDTYASSKLGRATLSREEPLKGSSGAMPKVE